MQVIDQINGSALFAQSAYSASVATNDDLGRKISTTYLTAVDLTPYATETLVEETSGAITSLIPTDYYPDSNPSSFATENWVTGQGYITGVDLSNYYTKNETSGADELSNAFASIPAGDVEVNTYVQSNSSKIDDVNSSYQTNSGSFLTAINIPESATWNDVASTYQTNSANYITAHQSLDGYATTSELNSTSSYLSGAIDNKLNTTAFTAYSADQWEMSAGSGISFVNDNVNKITRIDVTAQGGSTLPSAFVVEEDGQAYKVSAYTATINPTSTAFENGITEFPISEIGKNIYTTNISNGRWQLDGGGDGDISDNTIDLRYVTDFNWEHSTKLQVQDYSWPPQVATLSTTADIVDKTPYLLSGQGGGVPQSAFDELKTSYDALSSLFATYSGQWLLPNTGV